MQWFLAVLKNYATFTGRARRQEYWMYVLFVFIISIALAIVDAVLGTAVLGLIFTLAILVPSIAVCARRLHDTGRSGWWQLIQLIPLIGFIVLLIFLVQDSNPGENAYGANPKEA